MEINKDAIYTGCHLTKEEIDKKIEEAIECLNKGNIN